MAARYRRQLFDRDKDMTWPPLRIPRGVIFRPGIDHLPTWYVNSLPNTCIRRAAPLNERPNGASLRSRYLTSFLLLWLAGTGA
jgi:hypothetical protein